MTTMLKQLSPQHERRDEVYQQVRDFLHLIKHVKWYLIGTAFTLCVVTALLFNSIASRQPSLPATAYIGVENTVDLTAIKDVSGLMQAQSDLISSRIFLRDIVTQLALQVHIAGWDRSSIFDSICVESSSLPGTYLFRLTELDHKKNGGFALYFIPDFKGAFSISQVWWKLKPQLIIEDEISRLSTIDLNGMHLIFSPAFAKSPHNFEFRMKRVQQSVEGLIKRLTVKTDVTSMGVTNISVSVEDKDYDLAAKTVNRIADAFVEKNLSFKRQRAENVLASLEKQLAIARQDLSMSENAWRSFRTMNPTVGLTADAQQRLDRYQVLEKSASEAGQSLANAQALQERYMAANPENKNTVAAEIAAFLSAKEIGSGTGFQTQLNDISAEERQLSRNYAKDHPLRREVERKLENLDNEINSSLQDFILSMQKSQMDNASEGVTISTELQNLPAKELQLTQLDRRQKLAADIYGIVLNRYNQLKTANAGDVSEVFVMDYAVPPIPPPVNIPQLVVLLGLVNLAILFIPLILWNNMSRTVTTEYQFSQKTGKLLLESIPRSTRLKNRHSEDEAAGDGSILQIAPSEPDEIIQEIFRSLRTKVLSRMNETPGRAVVVTSLEPNAGKSTIAANLAGLIAQQNIKTLLIDADLRFGSLNSFFSAKQKPGLSEFLDSKTENPLEPTISLIRATSMPNLFFISSGEPKMISSELLASSKFAKLRKELAVHFPVIILDAPPIGPVIDAAIFDPAISMYLVVVKAGVTNVTDLSRKIAEFPGIEKNILGYVLNFASTDGKFKYYRYGRYYARKAISREI